MITINRRVITIVLMAAVVLLLLASVIGPSIGITSMFEIDKEGSVPVWFESFLYLLCAGLLMLIALDHRQRKQSGGWRWGVFSIFMLYLSVNTTAEINKKIVTKLIQYVWGFGRGLFDLLLFAVLAVGLILVLWPVLSRMPVIFRRKVFLAGLIFGVGAIVVDDLGELLFNGSNVWFTMLEELLEYSSFVILIDALLGYLGEKSGAVTLDFRGNASQKPEGDD